VQFPRALGDLTEVAWKIHSWSPDRGVGAIASPHFGPIPFDASANVDRVDDFREGEPVWVELDGQAPSFRVRVIRPFRQRQPPNTHWPPFDAVNGGFGDAMLEDRSSRTVQFWLGDCCQHCTPNPARVRFEDVSAVVGLDDECLFSDPLFRLASSGEIEANLLDVPPQSTAFCIVTEHGQGRDGSCIFIVARTAEIAMTW
jgi:hypothetical protein